MSIIKTERLTIRHIVADDWESIKEIWVDFNTSALSQYDKPHITDDEDVRARMAKWTGGQTAAPSICFLLSALVIPLSDIVHITLEKTDTRSATVSTPHTTVRVTQRKATWLSLTIYVSLGHQKADCRHGNQ